MDKECVICRKPFYVSPSRFRQRACSSVCANISQRKQSVKVCKTCKNKFTFHTCRSKQGNVLYCSKICYGLNNRDSKHYLWKGRNVTYGSLHRWVRHRLGTANHCEDCGLNKIPDGKKKFFDWANISGKYRRNVSDYKSLCKKCHKKFDGYGK